MLFVKRIGVNWQTTLPRWQPNTL